jgi:ribA/ribD-fused uncharacterized protein
MPFPIENQKLLLDLSPIDSFFGVYRFLSNFYPCSITYNGLSYRSSESAFQASKFKCSLTQELFVNLGPREAKDLGNQIKCRDDWDDIKIQVMREILEIKFSNPELRRKLEATRPKPLIEGNRWHDTIWGVCKGTCSKGPHKPYGTNYLGELLMEIRDGKMLRAYGCHKV